MDSIDLDLWKVFDTVPHNKFFCKLRDAVITGNLWDFFKAYFFGSQQCVVIHNYQSEWLPVSSAVPQGSILGQIMFILYITDLSSTFSFSYLLLFANDTKCCARVLSFTDRSHLQEDLDQICNSSTKVMLILMYPTAVFFSSITKVYPILIPPTIFTQ